MLDVDGGGKMKLFFEEPRTCSLCHHAMRPDIKDGYLVWEHKDGEYTAYVPCFCTSCRDLFFVKYVGRRDRGNFLNPHETMPFPVNFKAAAFPESVSRISPTFVETYNQSLSAESQGLNEICGMGYRRALEFLVKDYLISRTPDQTEAIKKELLGKTLNRIDDHRIKTLAERSAWIGNDETHYVRKHEDLDYNDMKRFINAMVRYIDSELTFEEALSISPVR